MFIQLSRLYWFEKIRSAGLLNYIEENFINSLVILFGSFSKAEVKKDSDIDLAIFSPTKKKLEFEKFERKLRRSVHVFKFISKGEVSNKNLLNNILTGFIIRGSW